MNSLLFFIVSLMLMLPGKPANKAKLMLESVNKSQYVAYQQAGIKGKVSFEYLNPGNYQLLIDFPQQEGKYLKERTRHLSMAKAAYDPKSRTYYYQGEEGFFL